MALLPAVGMRERHQVAVEAETWPAAYEALLELE